MHFEIVEFALDGMLGLMMEMELGSVISGVSSVGFGGMVGLESLRRLVHKIGLGGVTIPFDLNLSILRCNIAVCTFSTYCGLSLDLLLIAVKLLEVVEPS